MPLIDLSILNVNVNEQTFSTETTLLGVLLIAVCGTLSILLHKLAQAKCPSPPVCQLQQLGHVEKRDTSKNNVVALVAETETVNIPEPTEGGEDSQIVSAPFMTVPSKKRRRARRSGARAQLATPVAAQARARQEEQEVVLGPTSTMLVIRTVATSKSTTALATTRRRQVCHRRAWHVGAVATTETLTAAAVGAKKRADPVPLSKGDLNWFARTGFSTPEAFAAAKLEWMARGRGWSVIDGKPHHAAKRAGRNAHPRPFPAA